MTYPAVVDLIQAVEQADSPSRLVAAVRALAASRLEPGISTLIKALGYNNPEAAVAAMEGLVQLGDRAVEPILEQLDEYNYGARAYSFRALAAIADPRALETLLHAAENDFAPSVRRAAAKGLGQLRWSALPADQILNAQNQAFATLKSLTTDPEWATRYAAIVGLEALARSAQTDNPTLVSQIQACWQELAQQDADGAVKARIALAQQHLQASSPSP